MDSKAKVKVFNDTGYTHYLTLPHSLKTYKISPKTNGVPGVAHITFSDLEEILASDGGKEMLTMHLRIDQPDKVLPELGIEKEELSVSVEDIVKQLKTIKYDELKKFLNEADRGVISKLPGIVSEYKIVDLNVLKIVEDVTGMKLVDRPDGLNVADPKGKNDKE